ncbi:tape measure protein [Lactobacillus delbrueckii]|uniref:tape measure protein n=1 Tax=Lactobacillus delbrueckii TaxID=1584 RepID=UPI001E3A4AA1|nr:tape measure protein [Lactobacillus delbrueckii]MCD5446172.1 tape measure protein [Lactobacillus delbrueckii subsp. lactis]MCZ0776435.1 tape measure protein [Lactobacillus delbrueckii subsp. sunkii]MCZ0793544.1 tape measure protein [Lactobacillus delbrueckii]
MAKVQNEMATRITIDTVQAANSMQALRQAISANTNSWKAMETSLKSAGDYQGAAAERVKGLTQSIELQKQRINELRERQQGLDQSTQQGAQQFVKLENQISQANKQMASYEAQLSRAKSNSEYYAGGLANLQHQYELNASASKAYQERLIASGRTEDAQREKLKSLKSSFENLTKQQKAQENELEKIRKKSGEASDAYKLQKIRLDQTATAAKKTETDFRGLNASLNPSRFQRFRGGLGNLTESFHKSKKAALSWKGVVGANLISNAVTAGISTLTTQMQGTIKTGLEVAKAASAIKARWRNIGVSANGIKQLTATMSDVKTRTNLGAEAVNKLQTQLYGLTGSVSKTNTLTKGVASLSDQLKLSQAQAEGFAGGLTRIESAGTVTSGTFGRLTKQAPGLASAMAKSAGMSETHFMGLVQSGKMTSDQFNDILAKASKNYDKNGKAFSQTSGGAAKVLQENWKKTQAKLAEPLVKVQATGLTELNKALSDKDTQRGIQQIGSAIATLAVNLAKMLATLAKNQGAVKAFVGVVGGLVIFTKVAGWVNDFKNALTLTRNAMSALSGALGPAGWIILGITAVIAGLTVLYKHNKKFREFINGIASATKKGFGKALSAVKSFFKTVGDFFTGQLGWEKAIGKEISKIVSTIGKTFSKLGGILKKIGKTVIMAFVYALALPVGIGITIMRPLIKGITSAFSKLWLQVKKVWQTAWNGLVKVASAIWKPISKPIQAGLKLISRIWQNEVNFWGNIISTVWNTIKKVVTVGIKTIQTVISPVLKNISHVWNSTWSSISNFFGNIWDGMSKTGKKTFGGIRDWFSDILDAISKKWSDVWNSLSSVFSKVWDGIKSVAKTGWNAIIGFINTGVEGINSVIHFFGGKESTVPKLKKLAHGTSANERDEFALVNDEAGAIYREAIVRSSGKVEIPKKRNQLVYLDRGDEVISARKTAEIFNLNRYANGKKGWLSAAWDNVKDWAGDAFKAIEDALKDPLGVLTGLFHKGKNTATAIWHDMGEGAASYLPKVGVEWFKKQLEKLQDALTPADPSGSDVQRWKPYIEKAFKELHVTATKAKINKLLRQIQTESGGNPSAWQGVHDVNSGGNEARGLLQFAGSTWAADALPGHTDWRNGFNEILAAIHVLERGGEGGWGNVGNGHGWAMGGLISQHGRYEIAENNLPEYVIPTDINKRGRAYQLLSEVTAQFKHEDGLTQPTQDNQSISRKEFRSLESKLDQLIGGVQQLVQVGQQQIDATINSGNKLGLKSTRSTLYNAMGKDQRVSNYMSY